MSEQTSVQRATPVRDRPAGGAMAFLLGVGAVLYILLAAGCAAYLLWKAYTLPANGTLNDFNKLAIAALVAVVGTGLTGLASVYSATRQSATAYQVAEYNGIISTRLADIKASSDASLTEMKAHLDESLTKLKADSDESLARLKVALDAGQIARRELFGTATIYYYALRSIGLGEWDGDSLKAAETSMISATRHLIYVEKKMRNQWFDLWQRAQAIHRTAGAECDAEKRPKLVKDLMGQKVLTACGRHDLQELYGLLETTARLATETPATELPPE
jgi:hypothetical protein